MDASLNHPGILNSPYKRGKWQGYALGDTQVRSDTSYNAPEMNISCILFPELKKVVIVTDTAIADFELHRNHCQVLKGKPQRFAWLQ